MVKRVLIAQRKQVEIRCKLDENFTQRFNFFPPCTVLLESMALWLVSGWISGNSPWREKHSHQILLWEKKKFSIQKSESGQTNWHQCSSLFLAFLLYSVRKKTSDLNHNPQIFSSIMLGKKKKLGGKNQRKVILKSFAFTHANKFYASQ